MSSFDTLAAVMKDMTPKAVHWMVTPSIDGASETISATTTVYSTYGLTHARLCEIENGPHGYERGVMSNIGEHIVRNMIDELRRLADELEGIRR